MTGDPYRPFGCVVAVPDHTRQTGGGPGSRFGERLTSWLTFMVPMFIAELKDASDEQIDRARKDALDQIASHGDALQFGGEHRGSSRVALAKSFAILARAEGGVTALGVHACLHPHEGCPGRHRASGPPALPPDESQES
jgi:hypothetical protein